MNSQAAVGFTYQVEVVAPDGTVSQAETMHNLIPIEGLNHIMGVTFKGASQSSNWYVGLFEANYAPIAAITAAALPGLASECTAYSPITRPGFMSGDVAAGSLDNAANRAEFTFTSPKIVYGGFISSSPNKGATNGTLVSVVRFTSPKVCDVGSVLRVIAGNSLVSA